MTAPRDDLETRIHNTLTKLRQQFHFAEPRLVEAKNKAVSPTGRVLSTFLNEASARQIEIDALKVRIAEQEKNYAAARADFFRREAERQRAADADAVAAKFDNDAAKLREKLSSLENSASAARAVATSHRKEAAVFDTRKAALRPTTADARA